MSRHVRVSGNFVNLGKLYSLQPWYTVPSLGSVQVPINSVNLGSLYTRAANQRPPSWAYFHDGSIFIVPRSWFPHDKLEKHMNLAAQFIDNPTPKIQAIRQEDPRKKRLILISIDDRTCIQDSLQVLARNAYNSQRVTVVDAPFEHVDLQLDNSRRHITSARFKDAPLLKPKYRFWSSKALETFRGTLINGTLQPNVRLGNGLHVSSNPAIKRRQIVESRRSRNHEAKVSRKSLGLRDLIPAGLVNQCRDSSPRDPPEPERPVSAQQQVAQHQEGPQPREALLIRELRPPPLTDSLPSAHEQEIEQRKAEVARRELEQKGEILRWKRKTRALEQQLAMVTRGHSPTTSVRDHNDVNGRQRKKEDGRDRSHGKGASSDPHDENAGEDSTLDAFDFNDAAPPAALAKLRSRIQLPTRTTLRSKGLWRSR
ncbi:Nn.00g033660.m01.CDS01 [Neocucurbitaria sp. VM-36]